MVGKLDRLGDVHPQLRRGLQGRRDLERGRGPGGRPLHLARLDLRAPALLLRGDAGGAAGRRADRRRAGAGGARRLDHHRPHLAGRGDQEGQPGRAVADRAGRRAGRLQLLRLAARQPRGDDPRHLRQHPPPNQLVDKRGGFTRHFPDGEETTIYEAAMAYADEGVPLVVLAGKEYGSGSSRDWAAKGTKLLGVRAVIARELRAHPPLQPDRDGRAAAAVRRRRVGRVPGPDRRGDVRRRRPRGRRGEDRRGDGVSARTARTTTFEATVRLDTPNEVGYFRNGGILQTVLRQLK